MTALRWPWRLPRGSAALQEGGDARLDGVAVRAGEGRQVAAVFDPFELRAGDLRRGPFGMLRSHVGVDAAVHQQRRHRDAGQPQVGDGRELGGVERLELTLADSAETLSCELPAPCDLLPGQQVRVRVRDGWVLRSESAHAA